MLYGYIRVSTETQSEKGYGLDAQREAIEKYAKETAQQIESIYEDAGVSGNIKDTDDDDAINKRIGLLELLSVLESGDTVVVLNTSRLWRSDMTKAIIRRELLKREVNVCSIEQPKYNLYSKDPNDYLINAIMEALDVYERMSIALKLARGRTIKAKGGDKPAGLCPYGYAYAPDKKSVIILEEEAQAVRKAFTLAQTGQSLGKIADALNAAGVRTRRGNEWSKGTLYMLLTNRFYIGELTHAGQPLKGNHPPIISKVQFGKAAAQLNSRRRAK